MMYSEQRFNKLSDMKGSVKKLSNKQKYQKVEKILLHASSLTIECIARNLRQQLWKKEFVAPTGNKSFNNMKKSEK